MSDIEGTQPLIGDPILGRPLTSLLFMSSGKKTISRILYSPITYRYEDQDVLNNKNHALGHHSKVGLAGLVYPDQTKPIPLRATFFFPSLLLSSPFIFLPPCPAVMVSSFFYHLQKSVKLHLSTSRWNMKRRGFFAAGKFIVD